MKRIGLLLLMAIAIAIFSANALAVEISYTGDTSSYFVTYYSNNVSGAPDATLRLINDGSGFEEPDPPGAISIAADIYVFDDSQELSECGACWISADGILSEDVKTELTSNPLTGRIPTRGVIKVIADPYGNPTSPSTTWGLHGWATHIERATATSGAYATTEAPLEDANLGETEQTLLGNLCYYLGLLGSGQGSITCTPEDHDF
ncbi:MAG TPA: hypothetical protein VL983_00785 [Terriglobales bacterium]|nr:hypothetical protein [Terriglobales bacterium]